MKPIRVFGRGILHLACLGMILPTPVLQAAAAGDLPEPRHTQPLSPIGDVQLRSGDVLVGQVVGANGAPGVGIRVSLRRLNREVAAPVTDKSGVFVVERLPAGTYEVVVGQTRRMYRTWAPNTAPPAARSSALVVVGGPPIRGQCDSAGPISYWLGKPLVIAALVAAAVAIPVAIHNSRSHQPSSP